MNFFWRIKCEDEEDFIIVYTENVKKLKYKDNPMATYRDFKSGKVIAFQFKVIEGTCGQQALFDELGLTAKDEIKEKRNRRKE